jgi:hypothetical protein
MVPLFSVFSPFAFIAINISPQRQKHGLNPQVTSYAIKQ